MKPYMQSLIRTEDLRLFREIESLINDMPEVNLGVDATGKKVLVSSHMIAHALPNLFPRLKAQDGFFARRGQNHSWLTIRENRYLIIDPYPIALLGGPIMVHGGFATTPWNSLYIEARLEELENDTFERHVRLVTQAMVRTLP